MEHTLLKKSKIQFAHQAANDYPEILTDDALAFISALHKNFNATRLALLKKRDLQQELFDRGKFPQFPKETKSIREGDWTAGAIPQDLQDRRVEITGPEDHVFHILRFSITD